MYDVSFALDTTCYYFCLCLWLFFFCRRGLNIIHDTHDQHYNSNCHSRHSSFQRFNWKLVETIGCITECAVGSFIIVMFRISGVSMMGNDANKFCLLSCVHSCVWICICIYIYIYDMGFEFLAATDFPPI